MVEREGLKTNFERCTQRFETTEIQIVLLPVVVTSSSIRMC
jgi:hypothetical protein